MLPHRKPCNTDKSPVKVVDMPMQMASTLPIPGPRRQRGVFLRIRPGVNEATVVRPMNATAGEPINKLSKFSRPQLLEVIRISREQTMTESRDVGMSSGVLPVSNGGRI
jgi:hypothetical protein